MVAQLTVLDLVNLSSHLIASSGETLLFDKSMYPAERREGVGHGEMSVWVFIRLVHWEHHFQTSIWMWVMGNGLEMAAKWMCRATGPQLTKLTLLFVHSDDHHTLVAAYADELVDGADTST